MKLDTPVKAIDRDGKLWRINGEGSYDVVISTIPLPVLPTVMTLPVQVESAIKGLKYNSLTTALVDCPKTDITWMYIPGSEYRSHRIGYQSALTPYAVPNGGGAGAFEIIGERIDVDDSLINKSIPDDLQIGRLMDSEFTEYAYVIHDLGYQKNVKVTRDYFDGSQGMYSIGRWGSWNYNNMDLCMYEAFRLTDKITGSVK
jgi:protoporphyrinogen oxidase